MSVSFHYTFPISYPNNLYNKHKQEKKISLEHNIYLVYLLVYVLYSSCFLFCFVFFKKNRCPYSPVALLMSLFRFDICQTVMGTLLLPRERWAEETGTALPGCSWGSGEHGAEELILSSELSWPAVFITNGCFQGRSQQG